MDSVDARKTNQTKGYQNLKVEVNAKRCFTPLKNLDSPGLSPICYNLCSPVGFPNMSTDNMHKNSQVNANHSINLGDSGYLNHTLDISLVLKIIGLEQYKDKFEEEKIDFEELLTMKSDDFLRLGMLCMDHQKMILDFLQELHLLMK